MIIPESRLEEFAAELADKCLASRADRIATYSSLKHYYLFGAREGETAPYNKIYAHIDLLSSYLYSASTVTFDVGVAENEPDAVLEQARLLADRLDIYFHDHGISDIFEQALRWSLVFNSTFLKINWNARDHKLEPYLVQPHNLGVLREDVTDLERQEAFVHVYSISKDELRRRLFSHPDRESILARVSVSPEPVEQVLPEPVNRIVLGGSVNLEQSSAEGMVRVPDLLSSIVHRPVSVEDTIEMRELWVWDDAAEDYRTITLASPGILVFDRKAVGNLFGVKGQTGFIKICPNPLYDYFFGWSELTGLIKLQDWLSTRLREIRHILGLKADPPRAFIGFTGITDEKLTAFNSPGGWISEQMPNAKVESFDPNMPPDIWQEVVMIQSMFNDVSGISEILQGRGESGVRARAHADVLARLGAARIKKRAIQVEKTLEDLGRLLLQLMMAKDAHKFYMSDGTPFLAAQFAATDYQVHVDAHSASPIFVDDHVQLAFALRKFGAIDDESLLELSRPPRVDLLKKRLRDAKQRRAEEIQRLAQSGALLGKKGFKVA